MMYEHNKNSVVMVMSPDSKKKYDDNVKNDQAIRECTKKATHDILNKHLNPKDKAFIINHHVSEDGDSEEGN